MGSCAARWTCIAAAATAIVVASAPPARADATSEARERFARGAELAKAAKWSEALAAFESSFALVEHPTTLFNVGACERALGSYARARRTLERVQELDRAGKSGSLSDGARSDVVAWLGEIASILVSVDVHLEPADATIAVDGRPLEPTGAGTRPTLTAGLAAPGLGRPPPAPDFRMEIDPGIHVLVLSRAGFRDVVRRETFTKDGATKLDLVLAQLDGVIEVRASQPAPAVAVDGIDVGAAPISVRRPAGRYHVAVRKTGFVPFETDAVLDPGGRVELSAPLTPEKTPITKEWWFWTTIGGAVALAAVGTYFAARPDPERPAANGGGLGWVLRVP